MTHLIQCDGCGNIVGDRNDDGDPLAEWYVLSVGPTHGGNLLALPMIDMVYGDEDLDPEPAEPELPPDPDRHFCGIECLTTWGRRRGGESP